MNASVTAVIIAIVGVIGTLLAPIVSQRLSARARREEFDLQRLQQQEEYYRGQQEKVLANKRSCYITMISATRRYRLELMNYLYAVNENTVDSEAKSRLEEARLAVNTSLAECPFTGCRELASADGGERR